MNVWAAILLDVVNMNRTKKVALSGVLTALCFVFLFVGSLFQTLDLSAAALGSLVILVALIELGKGWASGVYFSASVLSIILLPSKSVALVFVLFSGFYPILKEALNRIKPLFLSYFVRILCFNTALSLIIFLSTAFIPENDEMIGFGIVIYLLGNITFLVYDLAIERVALVYIIRIKPKLFGKR